jgi:peptide/nickel transport system substrate-binding protein
MTRRIDRRSFLATGAAVATGLGAAAAVGDVLADEAPAAAYATNGPGRNGVSYRPPRKGGTLIMGVDAEEQGFDPTSASWDEVGYIYGRTVFDPLMIVTRTGGLQPYLAQSVTPNADYTTWTVTLRPNLVFHDGTPCDAEALNTNFEKQFASPLVGPAVATSVKDTRITGPLSVAIDMLHTWVPFPYFLTSQVGYVAAPSMLNNPNGTLHPIGTGPFVYGLWEPNNHFTAYRNPNYWRPGYPYLDTVTYRPIIEPDARSEALQAGSVDLMHTNTAQTIKPYRGNRQWSYFDDSGPLIGEPDINCIILNTSVPPFNDLAVRTAMAMAVDPVAYARIIDLGIFPPNTGLFVPGTPYYSKTSFPKFDPAGASKLVAQAAARAGKPISFTLQQIPDPEVERAAQYLQQQYAQVGLHASIATVEQNALIDNALTGKFQAATWRQFGAVEPDLNYVFWSTTTIDPGISINMTRNDDPRIQAALTVGRESLSSATRIDAYKKVNEYLAQDLPYIWGDRSIWAVVADPNVQNFVNPTAPNGTPALGMDFGALWPTQIWLKS